MTEGNTFQWATPFDTFASVAKSTQAQVFITVNYGTGTPEEAAAWVKHSNRDNCYDFKYWEIGNENYGSWEMDVNTRPHDNKHPTSSLNASIKIDGFRFCGPTDVYTYGIPQDEAARTGTGLADVAQTSVTMSGPSTTYTPAPYSATVIKLRNLASCHARGDCLGDPR